MGACRARHCEQQSLSEGAETTAAAAEALTQAGAPPPPGWTMQEPLPSTVPLKGVGEQGIVLVLSKRWFWSAGAAVEEVEEGEEFEVAFSRAAASAGCKLKITTTDSARAVALAVALQLRPRGAPCRG